MTGSRIGWICGPAEAIEHLINLATHTTYGVPGYIQDAAHFALDQGEPLEAEVSAPFARRPTDHRRAAGHPEHRQSLADTRRNVCHARHPRDGPVRV